MKAAILTPLVGYGYDRASDSYRLNADEEAFSRRVGRSPFWRESIARAATQPPPSPFVITAPAIAAGEEFDTASELFCRLAQLQSAGHATGYRAKGRP